MDSTLLLTTPLELDVTPELEAGVLVALELPATDVDGGAADEDVPATELPALLAPDVAPTDAPLEADDGPDAEDVAALEDPLPELTTPLEDPVEADVVVVEDAVDALDAGRDAEEPGADVPDAALVSPVLLLAGPPALELEENAATHWPVPSSQVSPLSHGTPGHNRPHMPLPWHTRPCAQSSPVVHW